MIHAALIVNNAGKLRLSKFYTPVPSASATSSSSGQTSSARQAYAQHLFSLIGDRSDAVCNFVDVPKTSPQDDQLRVIYRHYATLFFVFVVDEAESELGILDLIQVFVESLDRCFENVCELDLVFHFDEVHLLLGCIIIGGMVVDTSIESITSTFRASLKARKVSQNEGVISAPSMPSASAFDLKSFTTRFASGLSRTR